MGNSLQKIEVQAVQDVNGRWLPHRFSLEGKLHLIEDVGRRWVKDGEEHILVRTMGGETYTLVFIEAEAAWYLAPGPFPRKYSRQYRPA